MHYSKSISRKNIAKRIVISWVIVAAIFAIVGGIFGWAVTRNSYKAQIAEIIVYGAYDGRVFEGEMSTDWGGNLEFTPLDVPLDEDLQEFIFYLCAGYDIDFTFAMAMIQQESNFDADVVSATNDYGLMQINQCNLDYIEEALGITDILEPYNNVRAGLFILRKLFEKYETPERVLMAYNMGEGGASKLWGQGIFETNYSRAVLLKQQALNEQLEGSGNDD